MTTFLFLAVFAACLWAMIKDHVALVRQSARLSAQAQRKKRAADVDMRAVLEAAGRIAAPDARLPRSAPELPLIPPYESADPLWDRDLDQRGL